MPVVNLQVAAQKTAFILHSVLPLYCTGSQQNNPYSLVALQRVNLNIAYFELTYSYFLVLSYLALEELAASIIPVSSTPAYVARHRRMTQRLGVF